LPKEAGLIHFVNADLIATDLSLVRPEDAAGGDVPSNRPECGCVCGFDRWRLAMAWRVERLTAIAVAKRKTPGRYADGGGLYLQVGPTGGKSWLFRFTLRGRAREMGLGAVNAFSLADARARATKCRLGVTRQALSQAVAARRLPALEFRGKRLLAGVLRRPGAGQAAARAGGEGIGGHAWLEQVAVLHNAEVALAWKDTAASAQGRKAPGRAQVGAGICRVLSGGEVAPSRARSRRQT